jgi:hypothetical protein
LKFITTAAPLKFLTPILYRTSFITLLLDLPYSEQPVSQVRCWASLGSLVLAFLIF